MDFVFANNVKMLFKNFLFNIYTEKLMISALDVEMLVRMPIEKIKKLKKLTTFTLNFWSFWSKNLKNEKIDDFCS